MSRIGKKPVNIPDGVEVTLNGNVLFFKKGNLSTSLDTKGNVKVEIKDRDILFSKLNDDRQSAAYWGTYRALANNAIIGITQGFVRKLEINGVGYKAAVNGKNVELNLGYSHIINYELPKDIEASVEKNILTIKGYDKQVVGQVAAKIRELRPPEPYKGKGIKYLEEHIIRKAGKTAKK